MDSIETSEASHRSLQEDLSKTVSHLPGLCNYRPQISGHDYYRKACGRDRRQRAHARLSIRRALSRLTLIENLCLGKAKPYDRWSTKLQTKAMELRLLEDDRLRALATKTKSFFGIQ